MFVALILVLVAVGSVVFHLVSPWWWTPIASNWGSIDTTIIITFWITGLVYVAVILFTAYCIYRFRYQENRRAVYEPENNKLEWGLTIATSLGVAGLLAPGLIVWQKFITVPENASVVEVVGQQWQWSYRYPGKDKKLGTTNARFVSEDNPLGINPRDPRGQDDIAIEGGELHVPIGKPIKLEMRSLDVLHDFYVPQFRAKMDMVPGMITYFWFTPTKTGSYEILCAELCGLGHHAMRGEVIVENETTYQKWIQEQQTFKQTLAQARNSTINVSKLTVSNEVLSQKEQVPIERAHTNTPERMQKRE